MQMHNDYDYRVVFLFFDKNTMLYFSYPSYRYVCGEAVNCLATIGACVFGRTASVVRRF